MQADKLLDESMVQILRRLPRKLVADRFYTLNLGVWFVPVILKLQIVNCAISRMMSPSLQFQVSCQVGEFHFGILMLSF
ncbi:MAG: hypothetical protein CVU77_02885 [Elusimicrobia bacterium HGW-Elusimicrobia-1]|nr:MAG: hypothetical protein CVU77_02885 [Elusimicrobia bacterium HGW-Elusimicrobia-1]